MLKDLCFEVIHTCPNNCKFCSSNSSIGATKIISLDIFKRTINHFMQNGGIEEISISGGEPFLHPDLFEMVRFCKSLNIRTVIFTSGIKRACTLSEDERKFYIDEYNRKVQELEEHEPWNTRINEIVKRNLKRQLDNAINQDFWAVSGEEMDTLKLIGLDKIVFDLQAAEEQTYNELMGTKEMFGKVSLSMIRAAKAELNTDVHFVPMKPNYRQFPDLLEELDIVGVPSISILNFVPQGRGLLNREELMLSNEEMREFSDIFNQCKNTFRGNIRVGIPLLGNVQHLCTAGTEKLDIKYDGTVLPCPAFKEISAEKLEKYGIRLYNIYDDLEGLVLRGGKRKSPLCKQVYGFDYSLSSDDEER